MDVQITNDGRNLVVHVNGRRAWSRPLTAIISPDQALQTMAALASKPWWDKPVAHRMAGVLAGLLEQERRAQGPRR